MTNGEIIISEAIELMNKGIIGTTGNKLTMVTKDDDGNEVKEIIDEPEEIHTFAEWKALGFMVQKGQKAIAKFAIWNYASKPSKKAMQEAEKNGEEVNFKAHYYMKEACFFSASQVKPLDEKKSSGEAKKETKEVKKEAAKVKVEVKEAQPETFKPYEPTEEEKNSFVIDFNYIDNLINA